MKLKFYLRGLGVGMIVTATLMGFTSGGKEKLSDEEIKKRASELGMYDSILLSDMASQDSASSEIHSDPADSPETPEISTESLKDTEPTEGAEPEGDTKPAEETEPSVDQPDSPEKKPSEETNQPTEGTDSASEADTSGGTASVTVHRGDSSVSVSRALEKAGLVADAMEYDRFLCENSYDKSICVGTYEIPVGSTDEEIAQIITKRR